MATKDLSKLWGKNEKIETRNWLFCVCKKSNKTVLLAKEGGI